MRKMEAFRVRRVVPCFELLCFLAAWTVGILLALSAREERVPEQPERNVVATDATPLPGDLPRYRSYRPNLLEGIQEGG